MFMGFNKCKCGNYTEGDNLICERCRETDVDKEEFYLSLDEGDDEGLIPAIRRGGTEVEYDPNEDWLGGLSRVVKPKEKPENY
jgi:hypothetical protein